MSVTKLDILGVPVHMLAGSQAVEALDNWTDKGLVKLAYLNAHGSNLTAKDSEFQRALQDFVVLNDGIGLDIAAKLLHGRTFPENLNGTDFTVRYLRDTKKAWRIFLLGAKPGVAEAAARRLRELTPRHQIAGFRDGYFPIDQSEAIAKEVQISGANLILVALGNPAQEIWIAEHAAATGCSMAIGVGALFDFLSGAMPRAPEWVRSLRAEWLYRLWREPRRLAGRYVIGNPLFLARTLRQKFKR